MITNIEKYILNESFSFTLFCTISSPPGLVFKFTAGQYYKVFSSEKYGDRIKDDIGTFINMSPHFRKKEIIKNEKIAYVDYEYFGWTAPQTSGGVLIVCVSLTDTRYPDYRLRYDSNKFGL